MKTQAELDRYNRAYMVRRGKYVARKLREAEDDGRGTLVYERHEDGTPALYWAEGRLHDYNDSEPAATRAEADALASEWLACMFDGNVQREAASVLGRKGGQAKSPRKATSSRANGRKGGDGRKRYYILSGEGENGTWDGPIHTTIRGIRARLTRERCGGDRYASAWELVPECTVEQYGKLVSFAAHVCNIDTGDMRDVPEV
jgi:hypothetical protein